MLRIDPVFTTLDTSNGVPTALTWNHSFSQTANVPWCPADATTTSESISGRVEFRRRPVLIVPGIGGTYANTIGVDLPWLLERGRPPEALRIDPLTKIYADLITTLKDAGYQEGIDLFVVTYDWRLPVGPNDGVIDGRIGGLTAADITDGLYEYGVDYLGVFVRRAAEAWAARYPDAPPLDAVNVIAHSTGGLVARAYVQSGAYGGEYSPGQTLPRVDNLVMVGVPNRGASKAWNVLQDNWGIDVAYQLVLSKIVYRAYVQVMEKGQQIPGPDHTITRAMLESPSECPSGPKICFIDKYIPSARALLATYDFLDLGEGPSTINLDTQQRNSFVLDLNAGLDRLVNVGDDPNAFADLATVTVIYGTNGGTTPVHAERRTASGALPGSAVSFSDVVAHTVVNGDYYVDISQSDAGDGTVPIESAAGQFLTDTRVTLKPFTAGPATGSVGHGALMSNPEVQQEILTLLGVGPTSISTGQAAFGVGDIACAVTGCANLVLDPVEGFLVDGLGRRLGYTAATGPLAEIPGSFWSGDADGMGWILGNLEPPLTLQLTGLGGDYMAQVTTLSSEGSGGIELRGTLAAGEARTVVVPLSVVADTTNPTALLTAPDSIAVGQDLTVAGDNSFDVGGTIVRYEWTLDAFPPVETTTPSFTFVATSYPPTPGPHTVALVVVDDSGNRSAPDGRQVQVIGDVVNPTAVITGPVQIVQRHPLTVSGAGSFDPGGAIAAYRWQIDGGTVVETSEAVFTFAYGSYPLVPGPHVVTLTVVDTSGNPSAPAPHQVLVVADTVPTAVLDALPAIDLGSPLVVSGGGSFDEVGMIVRYVWQLDSAAAVETTSPSFTFTAPPYALGVGLHTVRLTVVDDAGQVSAPDVRQVEVVGDSVNPTAVLSAPTTIGEGEDLPVSGADSTDIGGAIVHYEWTLDAFAPVVTDTASFTFTAAAYPLGDGEHTVRLVVVDDSGNRSSPDERRVTVTARADTVQLHLRVEGLGGLPATITVRATARYLTLPDGISDPLLPSAPPCANAADCLFAPRAGSTVVIDVDPGGNLLTGPFVAGWTGCDAQANGRCYLTVAQDRTATVRVSRTRPVFAVGTTGGALFASAAGPGVLAFAAARTAAGDLLGGGAVVALQAAQYACGAVASVDRSGNRTTLVTRYGVKAPAQAGAPPIHGYACRIGVTDATSRSGRDLFTLEVIAPNGAVELSASGSASYLAFVTLTNVPVVW
ncbi:MAG: PKD domain-containing protein [Vicinamibacterales bacterium]